MTKFDRRISNARAVLPTGVSDMEIAKVHVVSTK